MLSTNMGFAMATHYCGGLAVESKVVFGHEALDCGMAKMDQQSCQTLPPQKPGVKKTPCCQNKYQSLDIEDGFKPTIVQTTFNVDFVAAFIVTSLHSPVYFYEEPQYTNYSPPLINRDIPVLHQIFLI